LRISFSGDSEPLITIRNGSRQNSENNVIKIYEAMEKTLILPFRILTSMSQKSATKYYEISALPHSVLGE
jgi:hypothetical protein